MSTVRYDSYSRGALRRSVEAVSGVHFLLMFVAAALLVLTRVDHPLAVSASSFGRQVAAPLVARLGTAAQPLRRLGDNAARFFTVESEFRQLERELASLRQLLDQMSHLAKRNEELSRLANLVKGASVSAVTVEVISGPRGLFTKAVEVAAGKSHGLRYGQPVFSGNGLFGRLVNVSEETASVLVLNDINSRIPVEVGSARWPALLVGDNSDQPRLVYLSATATTRPGDAVMTSGASGEFPRGIRVGVVARGSGGARVDPAASLVAGTYLTVLRYELPAALAPGTPAQERSDKLAVESRQGGTQ